jgi:ISXO2-like transposase domain
VVHAEPDSPRDADKNFRAFAGIVEIDEALIGGLAANIHAGRRKRMMGYRKSGSKGKIGVIAGVKRGENGAPSQAQAFVMKSAHAKPHGKVCAMVLVGSKVYTDSATLFDGELRSFQREMVNHSDKEYVRTGELGRELLEQREADAERHLHQHFAHSLIPASRRSGVRFNVRKDSERARFAAVLSSVIGRRLTYNELIGANRAPRYYVKPKKPSAEAIRGRRGLKVTKSDY